MTRRLCSKPPGSRPHDGHSCRNMFQRPYSSNKIYQVLYLYIPYQHILNYLRTITLAYIFLYRTSAHYKSDALLRTARALFYTSICVYHTDKSEHKPPPRSPVYINAPANSPVCTTLQHHGRLARPPWPQVHASAPVYNTEDNLLVRTGLQHRGRFNCLLTWPTCP